MKEIEADVLIIGSGAAGVMAALKAVKMGCKVALTSKVSMRSGNSSFAGGGWLVPSEDFTPDEYVKFVMEGGKGVNNINLVTILAQRGKGMLNGIMEMGIPLERREEKNWFLDTGGSKKIPGSLLMDMLLKRAKNERIVLLPWFSIMKLLLDDGRATGAVGVSKDGPAVIDAKSTVLATGGGGGIYRRHDNHRRTTGDGYALALEAGAPLRDMEFIQFHPLGLAEPHLPPMVIYPPYPKEARAIEAKGEDIIKKHGLQFDLRESTVTYRDQFTLIVTREAEKEKVYLDYTGVPEEKWHKHPLSRLRRLDPDFRKRPFCIAPLVHFFMGGVEIDERAHTAIPGLFAAGEITAGVHGANRMGGNALTECFVFGDIAGESAARYAMGVRRGKFKGKMAVTEFLWKDPTGRARKLLRQVQDLAWAHAGPVRNAESLREGLSRIFGIEEKSAELEATGRSVGLYELKSSLLTAKAILRASLERKESRGAFYREDFPERDDEHWLKNILLKLDRKTGDFTVSHRPVEGTSP
jgi:succinate dehydrogenase/fumarate reductase flavoprotein subunit